MTRGDTFKATVYIETADGNEYVPTSEDVIRFALKKKYSDTECLIYKDIPYDTMVLKLEPEDTKNLEQNNRKYVYDIEITMGDGTVDTFIPEATLILTNEVD